MELFVLFIKFCFSGVFSFFVVLLFYRLVSNYFILFGWTGIREFVFYFGVVES